MMKNEKKKTTQNAISYCKWRLDDVFLKHIWKKPRQLKPNEAKPFSIIIVVCNEEAIDWMNIFSCELFALCWASVCVSMNFCVHMNEPTGVSSAWVIVRCTMFKLYTHLCLSKSNISRVTKLKLNVLFANECQFFARLLLVCSFRIATNEKKNRFSSFFWFVSSGCCDVNMNSILIFVFCFSFCAIPKIVQCTLWSTKKIIDNAMVTYRLHNESLTIHKMMQVDIEMVIYNT